MHKTKMCLPSFINHTATTMSSSVFSSSIPIVKCVLRKRSGKYADQCAVLLLFCLSPNTKFSKYKRTKYNRPDKRTHTEQLADVTVSFQMKLQALPCHPIHFFYFDKSRILCCVFYLLDTLGIAGSCALIFTVKERQFFFNHFVT